MPKLELKTIKGHKYLYISDKLKVNAKTLAILFYVGRLGKIGIDKFKAKLVEFEKIKLKRYTDYQLKKYRCVLLNEKEATAVEALRYEYQLFANLYPVEFKRYEQAVFVHYAQGTTAIEGNTITRKQAAELFEHSVTPAGKSLREVYELVNFKELEMFIKSYEADISEKLIKKIHAIIMHNLPEASGGKYRQIQVWIEKGEYVPPPPFEIPTLMKDLIKWYRANKHKLLPLELAIKLHTKIVTIHPFVDGNGRLGRALLNFVLQRNGYPTLYLDLEHREKYLDVVAEGNNEIYKPIIDFMYELYLQQHSEIHVGIRKTNKDSEVEGFPEHERLLMDFSKIEKREEKTL